MSQPFSRAMWYAKSCSGTISGRAAKSGSHFGEYSTSSASAKMRRLPSGATPSTLAPRALTSCMLLTILSNSASWQQSATTRRFSSISAMVPCFSSPAA